MNNNIEMSPCVFCGIPCPWGCCEQKFCQDMANVCQAQCWGTPWDAEEAEAQFEQYWGQKAFVLETMLNP